MDLQPVQGRQHGGLKLRPLCMSCDDITLQPAPSILTWFVACLNPWDNKIVTEASTFFSPDHFLPHQQSAVNEVGL